MVPSTRRRAPPVKPEDSELDARARRRLKNVADAGPPTVGALRGRGRGRGAAPPRGAAGGRGGRGRGRGGGGGRGGLPPRPQALPPSVLTTRGGGRGGPPATRRSARPSYYSTSTASYYANVPRDSGYRPRARTPSPGGPSRAQRDDDSPPPLLPPAPPSPRRHRERSPDDLASPTPSPPHSDDSPMPYDYTLLRPATDQRWGEEESFNRRYSPTYAASIALPPAPLPRPSSASVGSASRSPEARMREPSLPDVREYEGVSPSEYQSPAPEAVSPGDDSDAVASGARPHTPPELSPPLQPDAAKTAPGPNAPPRFKPRNPNPRPNARFVGAARVAPPPSFATGPNADPQQPPPPIPLSAKAAGKRPAGDVKPDRSAMAPERVPGADAAPAPRTEGVLALRNDAFPPGCLGPASAARRAARTTWMRKLKADLADEGRTAVSFKWRDDGLAIDWVVARPRPARDTGGDDDDDDFEIVAPPTPARAPTPISVGSSPEPRPGPLELPEGTPTPPPRRRPRTPSDSPIPERAEPIVTRSGRTPGKQTGHASRDWEADGPEWDAWGLSKAQYNSVSKRDRRYYRKLHQQAKMDPNAKRELDELAAQVEAEGVAPLKRYGEIVAARHEALMLEQRRAKAERDAAKGKGKKNKASAAQKHELEMKRRRKLPWCSENDANVPSKERGVASYPLTTRFSDPAMHSTPEFNAWIEKLSNQHRHVSGDGFMLNHLETWVADGKLHVEWAPFTAAELEEQALNLLAADDGPEEPAQAESTAPAPAKQPTPRRSVSPVKRAPDARSASPVRASPRQQGEVRSRTPPIGIHPDETRTPPSAAPSSPPYSPSNPVHSSPPAAVETAASSGAKRARADSSGPAVEDADAGVGGAYAPPSPPHMPPLPAESPIEHAGWAPCSPPPPAKRPRLGSLDVSPVTYRDAGWYRSRGWDVAAAHEAAEAADARDEARVSDVVEGLPAHEPEHVPENVPEPAADDAMDDAADQAAALPAEHPANPAPPATVKPLLPAIDTLRGSPSPAPSSGPASAPASRHASVAASASPPPTPGAGTSHLPPRERYAELSARMERLFDTIDRWTRLMDRHPHRADGLRRQIERTEADIFALQNEMDAAQAEADAADAADGATRGAAAGGAANGHSGA